MRTSKDEPDRETVIVPRTLPKQEPAPRPARNDPAPQAVPERERKKAA